MTVVRAEFNAFGWKCDHIHGHSESVFRYTIPAFGSCGIELSLSPPGQHAQRNERYTQTVNARTRSTRDRVPFVIDQKYAAYLLRDIPRTMNLLVNSKTSPATPFERIRGSPRAVSHKYCPFLPFGATCYVRTDPNKQTSTARERATTVKASPCFSHSWRLLFLGAFRSCCPA